MKTIEKLGELGRRLRLLFRSRDRFDREMEEEMRLHRDLRAHEIQDAGVPAEEAQYAAQRRFGNTLRLREEGHAASGWIWLERIAHDVRYGLRRLRRSPGFTITAVLTLALGIGANTAIFTLIHALYLKSLPVTRPSELWSLGDDQVGGTMGGLQGNFSLYSYPLYEYLRDHTPEFSDLAAFQSRPMDVSVRRAGGERPAEHYFSEFVSGNYFRTFGVQPFAGRTITEADDRANSSPVAVINYRTWSSRFGADPSIIGETFLFQGLPVTVIGVTPPAFFGDTLRPDPPDFWISLHAEPLFSPGNSLFKQWNEYWLYSIGRLKPGADPAQVQAHVTGELRQWLTENYVAGRFNGDAYIASRYQDTAAQHIKMMPGRAGVAWERYNYHDGLILLMTVSALVLLIACANIANLLLARSTADRVQTAIRLALGAARARIIRQVLTEGLLVALLGGAFGLWIAFQGTRAILRLGFYASTYIPIDARPSLTVLGFALAVTVLTGIIFGAAPAWIASRGNPADLMRSGGGRTGTERSLLPLKSLLVLQVTFCFVLLVGTGLLTKSLRHSEYQQFGFQTQGRLMARIDLPQPQYPPARLEDFYRRLEQRLTQVPGVISASYSNYSPLDGGGSEEPVSIKGQATVPSLGETKWPAENRVSAHYFETIGTRILRGRPIDEHDTARSQHVAVIDESFARFYFPDEDPIGRHMGIQTAEHAGDYEIVGIVENAKYFDPTLDRYPTFFLPLLQEEHYSDTAEELEQKSTKYIESIQLRVTGRPEDFRDSLHSALNELDPNLDIESIRTFDEQVGLQFTRDRLVTKLTGLYGFLALILASIGLYGVASYSVARRKNEIGIRMALGAGRARVISMVLRAVMKPIALGLTLGIPIALAGARFVTSLLYGVKTYDPLVFSVAVAALTLCAAVAAFIPARRAASIDPNQALRTE
ncbi:MAG TPA: ABC transporter permease [Candidatus Angelobacter sp.]